MQKMNRTRTEQGIFAAAAVAVIAVFMPWIEITFSHIGSITGGPSDGSDGFIIIIGAIAVTAALTWFQRKTGALVAAGAVAALIAYKVIHLIAGINDVSAGSEGMTTSYQAGMFLAIAAAVALITFAVKNRGASTTTTEVEMEYGGPVAKRGRIALALGGIGSALVLVAGMAGGAHALPDTFEQAWDEYLEAGRAEAACSWYGADPSYHYEQWVEDLDYVGEPASAAEFQEMVEEDCAAAGYPVHYTVDDYYGDDTSSDDYYYDDGSGDDDAEWTSQEDAITKWMSGNGMTYAGPCEQVTADQANQYCSAVVEDRGTEVVLMIGPTFTEYEQYLLLEQTESGWLVTQVADLPPHDEDGGELPF